MTTNPLRAYHGDPAIKIKYLDRLAEHRRLDNLQKGMIGEGGKGCAVWCTLNAYNHQAYEDLLGIPRMLARLEDGIFESLPRVRSMEWPREFLEAIKPGADLAGVGDKFLHWLLIDPDDGVIRFAKTKRSRDAIQTVADLYQRKAPVEATVA